MQETLRFLEAVLPAQGLRVVAVKPQSWTKGLRHFFLDSHEAVDQATRHADDRGATTYLALATYADKTAGRTAANTVAMQSLWMDLDFKQFESEDQARANVAPFFDVIGPPTIQVQSGNGLHLYWCLTRPLSSAQWKPLATAFQARWQELGVLADAVSADAARVLRLPGSHNHKYDPPREVIIESFIEDRYDPDALSELLGVAHTPVVVSVPAALRASNDDLSGGLERRIARFRPLVANCQQMQWQFAHQDQVSEPQWHAMLQLVRHVENGDRIAHLMSNKHPGYSAQATDEKLAHLERNDIGPTTCDRFRMLNPAGCEGCPHNVTSPIVLGYVDEEPVSVPATATAEQRMVTEDGEAVDAEVEVDVPDEWPTGFKYDGYTITRRVKGENGETHWVPVYNGVLFPERITYSMTNGYETEVHFYVRPLGQAAKRIILSGKALADKRDVAKSFSGKGVFSMAKSSGHLLDLVQSMVSGLQANRSDVAAADQMGWQPDDSFVIGTTSYGAGREPIYDLPVPPHMRAIAANFTPNGSLESWKESVELYDRPGAEPYQFALCYGAAGVFLPQARKTGAIYSIYGAPGMGKSTAGAAALSWWGNPTAASSNATDTTNSFFNRASQHKNLPLLIDEVSSKSAEYLHDIAYYITQGREKSRSLQDGSIRPPLPPWALPAISTANSSVRGKLQGYRGETSGVQVRVIEVCSNSTPIYSPVEREAFGKGFYENYGLAGPVLVQWALEHPKEIAKIMETLSITLDAAVNKDNSAYRFWVASAASAIAVAIVGKQLGLLPFDPENLMRWTTDLLCEQKAEVENLAAETDVLDEFLREHANQLVVVFAPRNNPTGRATWPEDGVRGGAIVGRVDIPARAMYIAASSFRKWCQERGIDVKSYLLGAGQDLSPTGVPLLAAGTTPRSLGSGTKIPTGNTRAYKFSLLHPSLSPWANAMDDTVQAEVSNLKLVNS